MLKRLFASRAKPLGPDMKKLTHWKFDLSGAVFEIALPYSNTDMFGESKTDCDVNINDLSQYSIDHRLRESQGYYTFMRRHWGYWAGFGQDSYLGHNTGAAMVVFVPDLPEGMSCFCPPQLEQADTRSHYFSGPGRPMSIEDLKNTLGPRPRRIQPQKWKVVNLNGVQWATYQSMRPQPGLTLEEDAHFNSAWITPVSDCHYLKVIFPTSQWTPVDDSRRVLEDMIETIMSTVTLTLSPEAQAQKEAAEKKWPDAKYCESREPENWVYEEFVYQPETDTTEHVKASPPPAWQP
ncbi:MAG: hypothetical protein ACR2PX_14060 [Endozoicomonas sp.]|uniref:hypothetical protein n=1 Tax=Endozoicomonas sp. TaxID=1892382 RepID=UPI003D9AD0A3